MTKGPGKYPNLPMSKQQPTKAPAPQTGIRQRKQIAMPGWK